MTEEVKTIAQWGYSKNDAQGAQIPAEFMPKKSSAPIDKTDR